MAKSVLHLSAIIFSRTSVSIRKTSPSCVLLGFMCSALALSFPEEMATTPARERLKLGLRLSTTRSKLFLSQLSARSSGRRHSTSRAALAQEKSGRTGRHTTRAAERHAARRRRPSARRRAPTLCRFVPLHAARFADKNFTRRGTPRPSDERLRRARF